MRLLAASEERDLSVGVLGQPGLSEILEQQTFQLAIVGVSNPSVDRVDVIEAIKARQPDAEIIVIASQEAVAAGVRTAMAGAAELLVGEVSAEELKFRLARIEERRQNEAAFLDIVEAKERIESEAARTIRELERQLAP